MQSYLGTSLGAGVAIAAAARLEETYGTAQLAPERLRRVGEFLRRAGLDLPDPDQVIIVAERVPPGFLSSPLPGLEFVGAALGSKTESAQFFSHPAVGGLGTDLLTQTEEGDIVIVDGDRGRVYVSPDAQTLARYQGPQRRARRFFLEPTHITARRASNGNAITVLAYALTLDDAEWVISTGADGLFFPEDHILFANQTLLTASEQLMRLNDLMEIAGGKLVMVQAPLENVALSALARAAAQGPLHLVLPDIGRGKEARMEMDALEPELEEQDMAFGRVALDVILGPDARPARKQLDQVTGVVTSEMQIAADLGKRFPHLQLTALLPEADWPEALEQAMQAGATQVITICEQVQDVKDAVLRS